jgi:hypothetical protein
MKPGELVLTPIKGRPRIMISKGVRKIGPSGFKSGAGCDAIEALGDHLWDQFAIPVRIQIWFQIKMNIWGRM